LGFLRRLGGDPHGGTDTAAMGRVKFFGDGHAETGDGFYWAELVTSPSGTFALLWRDAPDDNSTAGYRTEGPGRYRLIEDGGGARCDGQLERPTDGRVANDGTFVLADLLFTDQMRSRLHIFEADGTEIIRRECRANVLTTYIEPEGRYAAAHLASNPDDESDDERFVLFDVKRGSEVWSKRLEMGRPDQLEFDVAADALWMTNAVFGRVRYGLTEGSVNVAALRETALDNADGFTIMSLVEEDVAAGVSPDRREDLVAACLRAADRLVEYPRHEARALRLAGEIVEDVDSARTLAYWDRALAIDPKVGIGKRAAALRDTAR